MFKKTHFIISDKNWLVFALITFFCWGISDFLPKIAVDLIDPKSVYFYESFGRLLIGFIILSFFLKFKPDNNSKGISVSLISGLLGGLGMLSFILAANIGKISQVVLFTALYPLLTILLAVVILREKINMRQGAGVVMALIALFLLS